MQGLETKLNVRDVFRYLLAYACWCLTTLLGLVSVFYVRNAINVLWSVLGTRAGTHPVIVGTRLRAFDRLGIFVILIIWAAYALLAEHLYRSSVDIARHRQFVVETSPADQAAATQNRLSRHLQKSWGAVLARRFLITTSIPVVLFVLAYLIQAIVPLLV